MKRDISRRMQGVLKAQGHYEGKLDGKWGPRSRDAAQAFDELHSNAKTSDPDEVRSVQRLLREAGLMKGPANGIWNEGSRAAMWRFNSKYGQEFNGAAHGTRAAALTMLDAGEPPARSGPSVGTRVSALAML